MGAAYTIFGKQVPSHILAILTLGTAAGVIAYPRGGDAKATPTPTPAPVSASKEEDFDLEKWVNDLSKEESK
ncbi:uncharacterized protein CLIB1423_05S04940 [[Candida] railenensis]|uniref:ATP synthase subunit K, mitochondrial n=1 Tax=[Candida] railenensis TaxID=45579 RepID=A0A9P0VXM9_9ASCO|nr:uncharacterized protein CLIB1423_05S04940 [[Candida] railenensis]